MRGACTPGRAVVARVRRRWRAHAPHLWWGDAVDVRFLVAAALGRLRVARNQCDYDDTVPQLPRLLRASLARAAQLVANLRRL